MIETLEWYCCSSALPSVRIRTSTYSAFEMQGSEAGFRSRDRLRKRRYDMKSSILFSLMAFPKPCRKGAHISWLKSFWLSKYFRTCPMRVLQQLQTKRCTFTSSESKSTLLKACLSTFIVFTSAESLVWYLLLSGFCYVLYGQTVGDLSNDVSWRGCWQLLRSHYAADLRPL